ncbi:hypothetical protein PHYC_03063 [Phycisphaerales bacterium]|nr:hypothetical protein PHYC_03063 [Phycisphaerales bacterium]
MKARRNRKAELPESLQLFVDSEIATGAYESQGEMIVDGLRMLQAVRHGEFEFTPETVRRIEEGMEDIRRGRVVDGPKTIAAILKRVRSRGQRGVPRRRAG